MTAYSELPATFRRPLGGFESDAALFSSLSLFQLTKGRGMAILNGKVFCMASSFQTKSSGIYRIFLAPNLKMPRHAAGVQTI
jgi:hypothetical protein